MNDRTARATSAKCCMVIIGRYQKQYWTDIYVDPTDVPDKNVAFA